MTRARRHKLYELHLAKRAALGLKGSSRVLDPTPQPLGTRSTVARAGESDEDRVWRRFSITVHKPGM